MELQLKFDNPSKISTNIVEPTVLAVTFYGTEFFRDIYGNTLERVIEIQRDIPE